MGDPSKERRYKILIVSDDLIMSLLFGMTKRFPQYIKLPRLEGLPEDVEILSADYEPSTCSFRFLIAHESFTPCRYGVVPEMIGTESVKIELRQYKYDDR